MMVDYTFLGPKWRAGPITWSFGGGTYPADQEQFPFSSSIPAGPFQAAVRQAVQRWAAVSGLTLQEVPDRMSPDNAPNIRIGFGKFSSAITPRIGEAKIPSGPFFTSDVVIRLQDPTERPVEIVGGVPIYQNTGGASAYQIALHEIGHALGLGHSASPGDNLYPTAGPSNGDLSASDVLGIRVLYPAMSVQLRGMQADYTISQVSGGQAYISDAVPGRDGVRTIPKPGRITFANGSALFDPSGTTEDVARLYQGAFGRTPDLQGLEDNAALVNTNTVGIAALAASFTASPEFTRLYGQSDTTAFVDQLYKNILGRAPDADGQRVWVGAVNATSRGAALLAFSDSQENHRRTLPIAGDRNDAQATRLYQAAFDRAPDAAGLALWSQQLNQGATVGQVAQAFVDSQEFAGRYGPLDADGFVTKLYANVLHRAPDAPGKQGWLNSLASGSRAGVLAGFADSDENRVATAGATHDGWVFVR